MCVCVLYICVWARLSISGSISNVLSCFINGVYIVFAFCCLALDHVMHTVETGEEMCKGSVCMCVFLHVPVCFRASDLV